MSYCSLEDILDIIPEQELINLTVDKPSDGSSVNIAKFNSIAIYADEIINGYLRAKYSIPLSLVPEFIKKLAADIVAYRLYSRRPQDMPEHIKENNKLTIETLSRIQKGQIILDLPQEHPEVSMEKPKATYLTNKNSHSRLFDDGVLRQYGIRK